MKLSLILRQHLSIKLSLILREHLSINLSLIFYQNLSFTRSFIQHHIVHSNRILKNILHDARIGDVSEQVQQRGVCRVAEAALCVHEKTVDENADVEDQMRSMHDDAKRKKRAKHHRAWRVLVVKFL